MSKKISTPLTVAIGTALVGGLTAAGSVSAKVAADNPFGMEELRSGYLVTGDKEGACGEGKCGEDKGSEGACGEDKGDEDKGGEGKCGEGKCGGGS